MFTKTRRKANARMIYLVEQYKKAHAITDGAVQPHLVASWAIENGLDTRPPITQEELLRKDIARALANDHFTDPKGREVRKNHAILIDVKTPGGFKRRSQWYTIYEAPPKHMRTSLQLRRRAALSDVIQLQLDFESYNDFNKFGEKLDPPDFDYNKDIAELKQSAEWPEGPDMDEEEDEDI